MATLHLPAQRQLRGFKLRFPGMGQKSYCQLNMDQYHKQQPDEEDAAKGWILVREGRLSRQLLGWQERRRKP